MTRKLLTKDENGYITNIGASKYWGVSEYYKSFAIQLYNSSNIPKWLIPEWKASDKELARIASTYYDSPLKSNPSRTVLDKTKMKAYSVNKLGRINKIPYPATTPEGTVHFI